MADKRDERRETPPETENQSLETQAKLQHDVAEERAREDDAVAVSRSQYPDGDNLSEDPRTAGAERPARPMAADPERVAMVMREQRMRGTPVTQEQAEIMAMHSEIAPAAVNIPWTPGMPVMVVPEGHPLSKMMHPYRGDEEVPHSDEGPPGGKYLVDGRLVDAYARPLKEE